MDSLARQMDSSCTFQTSIDDLPMEMIVEIFRYLNFGDLQCAALTCRRWLEASKGKEFMKKIIFRLNHALCAHPPVQLFMDSQRSFPNVRIEHNICKMPREFFKHMGKSAVAATFVDDDIFYNRFLGVLQDLRHLRTLEISGPDEYSNIYNRLFLASPSDRDSIAKTMANIRNLSIRSSRFSDANLLRLTSPITNLESLDIRVLNISPNTGHISLCVSIEELLKKHPSESELTFKSICGIIAVHQGTMRELKLCRASLDKDTLSALCQLKDLKLRTLCLSLFHHVDEIGFRTFLQTQSNLIHLDFSYSRFVTDECIETVIDTAKNLEILKLDGCSQITNSGMLAIAKLRKLRSLNISSCRGITSDSIIKGIASVTNKTLRQLSISQVDLSEECVKLCAQHLPELRILHLDFCGNGVGDHSVQAIIQKLKWLRELRLIGYFELTDAAFAGPNGGASIQQLKGLRSLNLNGCTKISDVSVINSFKFIELRCLDLTGCNISGIGIQAIVQNCPSLEKFNVHDFKNITDKTVANVRSQLKRF